MPETVIEKLQSEAADEEVALQFGYEILTYPADFTLEVLVQKWNKGDIKIAPGQRRFIWSQARASKLIESFLIGLPVPPIFFYQERGDKQAPGGGWAATPALGGLFFFWNIRN
jgi:hypothetical protein